MPSYYKQAIICEFFPTNIHLDNNPEETAPKRRPWHGLLSWASHSSPSFESKARAMPKVRGTLVSACSFLLRDVGNKGKERPRRRRQCKNYLRGMQTEIRGGAASVSFPMLEKGVCVDRWVYCVWEDNPQNSFSERAVIGSDD